MVHIDLCWDENGRNVVLKHGCASRSANWPFALFRLGSAEVDARVLSPDLRSQLELFGSAPLASTDERAIVSRLVAGNDDRLAA